MRRFVQLAFTVLVLTAVKPVWGADPPVDGFVARTYSTGMPYRLFIPPDYRPAQKYPLILWLHGSGSMGKDNLKQITGDSKPGTHLWTKPENQAKLPAFVLA